MSALHLFDGRRDQLADFCRKWKITELSLFGSALREDFGPESDVDVLVTFAPGHRWGLLDAVRMEQEIAELLGRAVDLVSRRAVERSDNWIRRRAILESAEVIYAAR
jgi:predicted nucleotidyltransferase